MNEIDQTNRTDQINETDASGRLADFFSILLVADLPLDKVVLQEVLAKTA